MPLKDGTMTRGEMAFIQAYAGTNDREKAEKQAKIAPGTGYRLLARLEVQREINRQERGRMLELLHLSNEWALKVMRDAKKPDTIKRDIAREVWKLTLGADASSGTEAKEPHEMTADELSAELDRLMKARDALAENAKDVTPSDGQDGTPFD